MAATVRQRSTGETSESLQETPDTSPSSTKDKKTIGRTSSGHVFEVPHTSDMVSTILDPREPKSEWDIFIVSVIALHAALFYFTSGTARKILFLMLFASWRIAYNVGIGITLHSQSKYNLLVRKAIEYKLFDQKQNPVLFKFLRRQLANKMDASFDFGNAPVEYQTWLLFRRGVDLILMLDFVSYVLLAISWSYVPDSHGVFLHTVRWTVGWSLVLFNLWVKLDANRVVRDFAWYWGDFFYLIDSDLTFDGVYELCMHPMYSLGYAGYYGISLLACSYAVLFTSIIAHVSQFIFLYAVEEPHINKTYNPKSPARVQTRTQQAKDMIQSERPNDRAPESPLSEAKPMLEETVSIFRPFDPFRATDLTQILIIILGIFFAIFTPQGGPYQNFSIFQAALWRFMHSFGIFYSLAGQSHAKLWTKHFLKYGESPRKAWTEWKNIYAMSLTMMHTTFIIAAWKCYSLPDNWQYSTCTLRHVLGIALVGMHIWTSISIYDVLGDFGWYFGDFFVSNDNLKLKYTGVYRYLNNPERVVYSFWGIALMTNSTAILALAAEAQVLNLLFITFIEKPHMEKLYGNEVRKEAGFTKSLKSMPVVDHPKVRKHVQEIEGSFDRVVENATQAVFEYFSQARPRFDKALDAGKVRVHRYSNSITLTRVAENLEKFDRSQYSLSLLNCDDEGSNVLHYGEVIRVKWTAPVNHTKTDWIGIYKVTDNLSTEITRVASQGHWSAVHAEGFADHNKDIIEEDSTSGIIELRGDTLPWTTGSFELRYHHAGKHNVMARSTPFEITIKPSQSTVFEQVEADLLPLIGRILSSQKGISAPKSSDDLILFADDAEKLARRITFAIHKTFGIEFAWQLIASDDCIRSFASRILQSQRILAPFTRFNGVMKKETQYIE